MGFVELLGSVELPELLELLVFCLVRWSVGWLSLLEWEPPGSMVVTGTEVARGTEKSRPMILKDGASGCRPLLSCSPRGSGPGETGSGVTERKRFVLGADGSGGDELSGLPRGDLGLEKRAFL